MERVKTKLHSQRGASMLFALLAFLVAAMVSVTIVAASVTTVKRIHSDREAQQNHLTLVSAAQLVRDEMEKTQYQTIEVTSDDPSVTSGTTEEVKGTFGKEMQAAVNYVKEYASETTGSFNIQVSNLEMKPVNVSYVMTAVNDTTYHIVFTLSIEKTEETLFLSMQGQKVGRTEVSTTYGKVTEGGIETTVTYTTTTITTTYTWSSGTIYGVGGTNETQTQE